MDARWCGRTGRPPAGGGSDTLNRLSFYPRGASNARILPSSCVCLFVCVCISHAGIVSKRLNIANNAT